FLEVRADVPGSGDAQGGHVSGQLLAALGYVCYRPGSFHFCGFGGAGALRGNATGLPSSREVTTPWAAVGIRAAWSVMLAKTLGLRVFLDGIVPLTRTVLVAGGGE